jgi:hypothetical protein
MWRLFEQLLKGNWCVGMPLEVEYRPVRSQLLERIQIQFNNDIFLRIGFG